MSKNIPLTSSSCSHQVQKVNLKPHLHRIVQRFFLINSHRTLCSIDSITCHKLKVYTPLQRNRLQCELLMSSNMECKCSYLKKQPLTLHATFLATHRTGTACAVYFKEYWLQHKFLIKYRTKMIEVMRRSYYLCLRSIIRSKCRYHMNSRLILVFPNLQPVINHHSHLWVAIALLEDIEQRLPCTCHV